LFTFEPGSAKKLKITPFSVTHNCGSIAPFFYYTGLKSDGVTLYNAATDYLSVDSSYGDILIEASLS
jgi:hypothetical protein